MLKWMGSHKMLQVLLTGVKWVQLLSRLYDIFMILKTPMGVKYLHVKNVYTREMWPYTQHEKCTGTWKVALLNISQKSETIQMSTVEMTNCRIY